jgi:2-iminobutanoate/2-iminopropanoate deaminase
MASRTLSETWSETLSGCPSPTDSDVNKYFPFFLIEISSVQANNCISLLDSFLLRLSDKNIPIEISIGQRHTKQFNLKSPQQDGKNMKKTILNPKAPKPIGPYNQAVQAGKFLFISGQLAIDAKQSKIVTSDITTQTHQVIENIKAILEAANYGWEDVVSTTVYLASMALFEEFNHEYAKHFSSDFPARATIACELKTGALVEISAVAYKE